MKANNEQIAEMSILQSEKRPISQVVAKAKEQSEKQTNETIKNLYNKIFLGSVDE